MIQMRFYLVDDTIFDTNFDKSNMNNKTKGK